MIIVIIILSILIILLTLMILYLSAYNKLSEIAFKINNSNDNIKNLLQEKQELMNELAIKIKKVCRKKDYLKDFNDIKNHKLNTRDLDIQLDESFETMLSIQEDHKSLKNDEFNNIVNQIKKIDQNLIANKKFFNKNNNILIKNLKGYYKYVAKYSKINVLNSYELKKEPKDS